MTEQDVPQRSFDRDMFEDFDFNDPEFNERFDDVISEMASKCPVAHSNVGHGYKVLNTYKDVKAAARDWRTFSSAEGYLMNRPEGTPVILPEESDPPYHDKWRKALNPFFSPGAIAEYEDNIRVAANELIDTFIDKGRADFVSEYAALLPGIVLFRYLVGVPEKDLPKLFEAIDKGTFGPMDERPSYFQKANDYLADYLREREQEEPKGDVIDAIVEGVERPDGSPATWEDKVAILLDVVFGGLATTTHAMAAAIGHLAEDEGMRKELATDPELVPQAVEEFIRLMAPVVAPGRVCTKDTTIGDLELKEGDWVALNFAAASRDPEITDRPSEVDIHREDVIHPAFGVGAHRCLGSHLARLEMKVTLEEFLRRIPQYDLTPGTAPVTETSQLRTTTSLDITFPAGGKGGA